MPDSEKYDSDIWELVEQGVRPKDIHQIMQAKGLQVKERMIYYKIKKLKNVHQRPQPKPKNSSKPPGAGRFRYENNVHSRINSTSYGGSQHGSAQYPSVLDSTAASNKPQNSESEEPVFGRAAYGRRHRDVLTETDSDDGDRSWSQDDCLSMTGSWYEDMPIRTKHANVTAGPVPFSTHPNDSCSEEFIRNLRTPIQENGPNVSMLQAPPYGQSSCQITTTNFADLGSAFPTETTRTSRPSLVSPSLPSSSSWVDIVEPFSATSSQVEPPETLRAEGFPLGAPVLYHPGRIALRHMHSEYHCCYASLDSRGNIMTCQQCGLSVAHFAGAFPDNHSLSIPRGCPLRDRYNNSPSHYLAASGKGDLKTLCYYDEHYGSFQARNTFGETPLHVLDTASLTAADLESLLRLFSYQFLLQARDNRACTVMSALAARISSVDQLWVLFRVCNLDEYTANDHSLWQMFNTRDCNGQTVVSKIFSRLQRQQSDPSQSGVQRFDQLYSLIAPELNRQHLRNYHVFNADSNMFEERFVDNFDSKAHQDLFMEDEKGRSILHAIPWFRQDPSIHKEKLKWALDCPYLNSTISALIGLDVNKPDDDGYAPLHSAVLAVCYRRPRNIVVGHLRQEAHHLGLTETHNLQQFSNQIRNGQRSRTTARFVTGFANEWQMSGSTLIRDFFERARAEQVKQEAVETDCLYELLRKRQKKDILKALQRSDSTDNIASVPATPRKQKRHSLPPPTIPVQDIVEIFCSKGANVNQRDQQGCIPLHCACTHGIRDYVRMLLYYGSNPNARDNAGKSVIAYARERESEVSDPALMANIESCIAYVIEAGGREEPTTADEYFARDTPPTLAFLHSYTPND